MNLLEEKQLLDKKKRLLDINVRINDAAKTANRRIEDIFLIAVSKTFSVEEIRDFYHLGLRHFAENYIQEWLSKLDQLPQDIIWHVIGNVQSNKTKFVAQYANWVHSVDQIKIARRLNDQRPENMDLLNVCVEVNIARESQKHGVLLEDLEILLKEIKKLPRLVLRGLMCVPTATDLEESEKQMQLMHNVFLEYQKKYPQIDVLSMGMSSDMDIAIRYGATHIRIGTSLFGKR